MGRAKFGKSSSMVAISKIRLRRLLKSWDALKAETGILYDFADRGMGLLFWGCHLNSFFHFWGLGVEIGAFDARRSAPQATIEIKIVDLFSPDLF